MLLAAIAQYNEFAVHSVPDLWKCMLDDRFASFGGQPVHTGYVDEAFNMLYLMTAGGTRSIHDQFNGVIFVRFEPMLECRGSLLRERVVRFLDERNGFLDHPPICEHKRRLVATCYTSLYRVPPETSGRTRVLLDQLTFSPTPATRWWSRLRAAPIPPPGRALDAARCGRRPSPPAQGAARCAAVAAFDPHRGAFEKEIARIGFLEGNSNQGDALCYEPVGTAPSYCE